MSYKPSVTYTPATSSYCAIKDGTTKLKTAALITDNMMGRLHFEAGGAREVYKNIRKSKGSAGNGKSQYMYLAPLHVKYDDGFVTDKWYVKGVVLDLKKDVSKSNGKYGQSFLSVGIPEKLYDEIKQQIVQTMGIKYDEAGITRNGGYVWQNNNIDPFKDDCYGVKGSSATKMNYNLMREAFDDNPVAYGVLDLRIKCGLDQDDLDVAIASRKWIIGWALQAAYVYSHTTTGAPTLSGTSSKAMVALPKEDHSDQQLLEAFAIACRKGHQINTSDAVVNPTPNSKQSTL